MTPDLLADAQAHAACCYPRESCGVVIDAGGVASYRHCRNQATEPDTFDLDADDLTLAEDEGRLIAYVHSHPDGPVTPSGRDLEGCELSGLPWFIVAFPMGKTGSDWTRVDPVGRPYEGRRFVFGVDDCWSIVREWYARERGLDLPDFVRTDKFWERGETPHLDHLTEVGFRPVLPQDMQIGDGILFRYAGRAVDHCGVYVGHGRFLHHVGGRLSRVDDLDGRWIGRIEQIVRHQ